MSGRLNEARDALDQFRSEQSSEPPNLFATSPVPTLDEDLQATIRRPAVNAGPVWRDAALTAVRRAAEARSRLTVEDVWEHLDPDQWVYDARAIGSILLSAAKRGWIARVPNEWVTSRRRTSHSRPVAVWSSNLHRGAA